MEGAEEPAEEIIDVTATSSNWEKSTSSPKIRPLESWCNDSIEVSSTISEVVRLPNSNTGFHPDLFPLRTP